MQCCSRAGEMGAFCLAKAPPGACVGSPFWPQEKLPLAATAAKAMVPLPPGLCWGQGCDRALSQHNHCAACSLGSVQPLIHAWLLFAEKQGTEAAASSANVPLPFTD